MKMKKKKYIILFFVILFYGCSQNNNLNHIKTYKIESEKETVFEVESISSFAGMISLETTKESIIGRIRKVFLTDSVIIIWDEQTRYILLFDRSGKYIRRIGRRGPGPEEYREVADVYYEKNENKILVSDPSSRKVIEYDLCGNFFSSWRTAYCMYAFYPTIEGYWGFNSAQNDKKYHLIHVNRTDGKIDKGYFTGNDEIFLPYHVSNYFSENEKNNDVIFHFPYHDTIYKIINKTLQPFLHIDFGKRKNTHNIYSKVFQSLKYDGKITNVHSYGDYLFFSFICYPDNEMQSYNVFINLNEQTSTVFNFDVKHSSSTVVTPLPNLIGLSQGKLIYQINPQFLPKEVLKGFDKIFDITNESNPILVFYNIN